MNKLALKDRVRSGLMESLHIPYARLQVSYSGKIR